MFSLINEEKRFSMIYLFILSSLQEMEEEGTDGEQLGLLLPSVWWQLSPLWRLCALALANVHSAPAPKLPTTCPNPRATTSLAMCQCKNSAEDPPGLVEVAAEVAGVVAEVAAGAGTEGPAPNQRKFVAHLAEI